MGKIIAVTNQKGGVGKTTTCINLAAAVKSRGKKVLVVDMDPQGNCTSGLGLDKAAEPNIYDVLVGREKAADAVVQGKYCHVIPSNKDLSGASVELVEAEGREYILRSALAELKEDYHFIFIDCPPSLELLTVNALTAADSVLIPVQCEYYAMEGLADLTGTVKLCQKKLNPGLAIEGLVLTMYDGRVRLSAQVEEEVRRYFGEAVYKTVIPRNVRLSEAPSYGMPVAAYDRFSKGSLAYGKLAKEFLRRQKQPEAEKE